MLELKPMKRAKVELTTPVHTVPMQPLHPVTPDDATTEVQQKALDRFRQLGGVMQPVTPEDTPPPSPRSSSVQAETPLDYTTLSSYVLKGQQVDARCEDSSSASAHPGMPTGI